MLRLQSIRELEVPDHDQVLLVTSTWSGPVVWALAACILVFGGCLGYLLCHSFFH